MDIKDYFNKEFLITLYKSKLSNSRAKGIDKINFLNFEKKIDSEIDLIIRKINSDNYSFSPYIENLKLKGRNKVPRMISIPTLRDRLVLLAIKEILHDFFPENVNRKLPNSYIRDIKKYLEELTGNEYYIKLDIEKFYDNIDTTILLDNLRGHKLNPRIISLIELAINTPTVPIHSKKDTYIQYICDKGIPQGLSISNILAQIYLDEVDKTIDRRSFFYRRYVDDIIVLNHEIISDFRYKNLEKALNQVKLNINHDKTEKGILNYGFTFLGYKILPNKISIANGNIESFIRRIAGKITWFKNGIKNKSNRPMWLHEDEKFKDVFIEELNETITGVISTKKNYGWLFYFIEMTDESLLHKIDNIISGFFYSLDEFDCKRPDSLKKLSRAYKVIKFQKNKNYIASYDKFDSIRRKRNYLIFRGKISPEIEYTDEQINYYFERFKKKQLKKIEKDIGYRYNF